MKNLITTVAFLCAITVSAMAQNKGVSQMAKEKIDITVGDNGTMRVIWGKTGKWCVTGGLYCYIKPHKKKFDDMDAKTLDADATITEPIISIDRSNNITITSIGRVNNLSKETLEKFINKRVETPETTFPNDFFQDLFKSIKLNVPKEEISFTSKNQKYNVVSTTDNGKPVQVIEAYQKTQINIDGKTYNLLVITTSGKGAGSPKQASF